MEIQVIEKLTKEGLKEGPEKPTRKDGTFLEDDEVDSKFRSKLKDYARSGYDRGHMSPASNSKSSLKAYKQTFLLTNMSPQIGKGFNQEYWRLSELFCQNLTSKFDQVWVLTGSLYLPKKDNGKWLVQFEMIGNPPNVAVPTHFFKSVLTVKNGKPGSIATFVLPNTMIDRKIPLKDFLAETEFVERSSGLNIFDKLDKKKLSDLCDSISCAL